jgi:hypothetical protein
MGEVTVMVAPSVFLIQHISVHDISVVDILDKIYPIVKRQFRFSPEKPLLSSHFHTRTGCTYPNSHSALSRRSEAPAEELPLSP